MPKAYIERDLADVFIQMLPSSAGVPIMFPMKNDAGLWLCANYAALNLGKVRIEYPHSWIRELLESVRKVCIFTNLDLWSANHRIHINEEKESRTVFRTSYSLYDFHAMHLR